MRKRKHTIAVLGILLLAGAAAAQSLTALRGRSAELQRRLTDQTRTIAGTSQKLDRLSVEIHALKREQENGRTIFRQYHLQSKLQEAQEVSDRLSGLTEEKRATERAITANRRLLTQALDRAIEETRAAANTKTEDWKTRGAAVKEMEKLLAERMRIPAEQPAGRLTLKTKGLLKNGSAPDEAGERLIAIRDLERRMEKELASAETELSEAKRQRFLRNELAHLMDEESFFSEQGFVQNSVRQKDGTVLQPTSRPQDTAAAAAKPDAAPKTPASIPSPAAPENPPSAAPAALPNANAPASAAAAPAESRPADAATPGSVPVTAARMNAAIAPVAKEPGVETAESRDRDPIAQLAGEFGAPAEQKKEAAPRAASAGDEQIRWLESRVQTTRYILERLKDKARELEKRLTP